MGLKRDTSLQRGKPGPRGALPDHFLVHGRQVRDGGPIEVKYPDGWKRGALSIRRNGRHELAAFFVRTGEGAMQLFPGRSSVRVPEVDYVAPLKAPNGKGGGKWRV